MIDTVNPIQIRWPLGKWSLSEMVMHYQCAQWWMEFPLGKCSYDKVRNWRDLEHINPLLDFKILERYD